MEVIVKSGKQSWQNQHLCSVQKQAGKKKAKVFFLVDTSRNGEHATERNVSVTYPASDHGTLDLKVTFDCLGKPEK